MVNPSLCKRHRHGGCYLLFLVVGLFSLLAFPSPVRADIAPPESPPGSNLLPGSDSTQVRMESETVILDVLAQSQSSWIGQAKVTATFHMRNLGSVDETIQVRFPLSNWNGWGDGFGNFPEIRDLRVKLGGRAIPTQRIITPNSSGFSDHQIPWATFPVTFPAQQEVQIEVTYTADGFGEDNYVVFNYIMETGAGWHGTIGQADLIVRLPFEANPQNVIFEQIGFGMTTPGAEFRGSELYWQYLDLEPETTHNLQVVLVIPAAWNKILLEQGRLQKNPSDGEAWGRLGKAYKEIILLRKGMREDAGGQEAYRLAVDAYDRAVTLKPQDALWHYGFADLLWSHFYWTEYWIEPIDYSALHQAVRELQQSLEIDPGNQQAAELLESIGIELPEAVAVNGSEYTYLILTATPEPRATATQAPSHTPTATWTESPTTTPISSMTPTSTSQVTNTPVLPAATEPQIVTAVPSPAAAGRRGLLPCGAGLLPWVGLLLIGSAFQFTKFLTRD